MAIYLDIALSAGILVLAWLSLSRKNLFKGIVLFIVLGLTVAIAWARLGAWDVAIAEAAIGAGLTGGLLLLNWRNTHKSVARAQPKSVTRTGAP